MLTETKIMKCIDSAERSSDRVIRKEKQRPHHCQNLASAFGRRVNAAAIGIDAADVGIRPADSQDQQAHRADQPERASPGHEEREAQDVKARRAPVAKEKSGGLEPVDVARPLSAEQCERARPAALTVISFHLKGRPMKRVAAVLPAVGRSSIAQTSPGEARLCNKAG